MARKLDNPLEAPVDRPVFRPRQAPVPAPAPGVRPAPGSLRMGTTFQPGTGQTGTLGNMTALPQQLPGAQPGIDPQREYFRNEQLRMIQALQQAAQGDPNSRAQQQMRDIYGQQRGQIASGISGARGVAAGAAQEMIQRGQTAADQSYSLDSRALMSQEQQRAQQALMTELGYMRDQGINEEDERVRTALAGLKLGDDRTKFDVSREYGRNRGQTQDAVSLLLAQLGLEDTTRGYNDDMARKLIEAGATGSSAALDIYMKNANTETKPAWSGKLTDLYGDK